MGLFKSQPRRENREVDLRDREDVEGILMDTSSDFFFFDEDLRELDVDPMDFDSSA